MEAGSSSTINSNSIAGCSNYIPRTPSPNILPILGLEGEGTEISPGIPVIKMNDQNHNFVDAQTSNLREPQSADMEVVDETMPNPESEFSSGRPEAPVAAFEGFEEDFVYAVEDDNSGEEVMVVLSPGNAKYRRKIDKGTSGSEGKGVVETQLVDAHDTDATSSCSICMEPWTSGGNHRISCLPCGHLFGRPCIMKWIRQRGGNIGKCPQCNKMCKVKDIRTLYVSRIAAVDGEMLQELTSLRAENEKLVLENKNLKDERRQRKSIQLGLLGLGAGNSPAGNLSLPSTATVAQQPAATQEKYIKVWEGLLGGSRQGKPVPICRLEGYRNIRSSEIIAADWPSSMQIIRLISQDHITSRHYQGKADFLIFRQLNSHGFLVQLAEKKLSAVIQLPTQTLLLSTSDKPGRMIGMLFPGDTVVFEPQLPSQPRLQQQQQQQQPQGMPSAMGQAFAQGQLPNQTRPQLMLQSQFQGQGPESMPGATYLT